MAARRNDWWRPDASCCDGVGCRQTTAAQLGRESAQLCAERARKLPAQFDARGAQLEQSPAIATGIYWNTTEFKNGARFPCASKRIGLRLATDMRFLHF